VDQLAVNFRTNEGYVHALDGVSFELRDGEILGIIGESGSGKSTIALSLLDLLPNNADISGQVNYLDSSILKSKDTTLDKSASKRAKKFFDQRLAEIRWKEISMIFQGAMNAFNPVHTIRRQINEVFSIHGTFSDLTQFTEADYLDEKVLREKAREISLDVIKSDVNVNLADLIEQNYQKLYEDLKNQLASLSDSQKRALLQSNRTIVSCLRAGFNPKFLDAYPHELSGGMRQRGIISMALALNPRIILADEPTTGLDVITQAKIIEEIKKLIKNKTVKAMILISHDVGVVSQLSSYVMVMYAGRVMEYGTIADVLTKTRNPYTFALLRSYPSVEEKKMKISGIPGSVPDLLNPPSGCYFATRCFMSEDICFSTKPKRRDFENSHTSLCHFDGISLEKYREFSIKTTLEDIETSGEKVETAAVKPGEVLVEAKDLSKYFSVHTNITTSLFGGANKPVVHAVDNVNFEILKGTIVGVVGESGSGKTTLGRLLVNAIEPTSGAILFNIGKGGPEAEDKPKGIDIANISKKSLDYRFYRKEAQIIFQDPYDSINPKMPVIEIVAEPLKIHLSSLLRRREEYLLRNANINNPNSLGNLSPTVPGDSTTKEPKNAGEASIEKEVKNALIISQLRPPENYLERFPHELSGGERQRVSIARVITLNPSLIVADEPISMLDVSIRANVMNVLLDIKKRQGVAILYISHDIASARYVSDVIAIMYLGQIVEFGPTEEIITNPLHPYTKALIAAVPYIDPTKPKKTVNIIGDIGSSINPKVGCRFYERCVYRKDICKEEDPPFLKISGSNRYYMCHFEQGELIMEDQNKLKVDSMVEA
jgi:peptide/nickel transport system ATP-binding protein